MLRHFFPSRWLHPLAPLKRLSPVNLPSANGFNKPFAASKFELCVENNPPYDCNHTEDSLFYEHRSMLRGIFCRQVRGCRHCLPQLLRGNHSGFPAGEESGGSDLWPTDSCGPGGSRWLSALPTGSKWLSAPPTGAFPVNPRRQRRPSIRKEACGFADHWPLQFMAANGRRQNRRQQVEPGTARRQQVGAGSACRQQVEPGTARPYPSKRGPVGAF